MSKCISSIQSIFIIKSVQVLPLRHIFYIWYTRTKMNYRFMNIAFFFFLQMMLITMCWETSIWGLKRKIGGKPGSELPGLVGVGSLPNMLQHCLLISHIPPPSKFWGGIWLLYYFCLCTFSLIYLLSYYCEVCVSSLCILNKFVSRALWSFSSQYETEWFFFLRSQRAFDFGTIK